MCSLYSKKDKSEFNPVKWGMLPPTWHRCQFNEYSTVSWKSCNWEDIETTLIQPVSALWVCSVALWPDVLCCAVQPASSSPIFFFSVLSMTEENVFCGTRQGTTALPVQPGLPAQTALAKPPHSPSKWPPNIESLRGHCILAFPCTSCCFGPLRETGGLAGCVYSVRRVFIGWLRGPWGLSVSPLGASLK